MDVHNFFIKIRFSALSSGANSIKPKETTFPHIYHFSLVNMSPSATGTIEIGIELDPNKTEDSFANEKN